MPNFYFIMLRLWTLCFFLLFLYDLQGEGTKQLRPNYAPSNRAAAYITIRQNSMACWSADSAKGLYIHISDTSEVIYYGFGHVSSASIELNEDLSATDDWNNHIEYRIIEPGGKVVVNELIPISGQGFIGDSSFAAYKRAVNGPQQLVGDSGYYALAFYPKKTGDYSIEFRDPFDNGGKEVFQLFDITVGSKTGEPIPGRIWAYLWRLITFGTGQEPEKIDPFEGKLYTYSSDQVVTEIEFDDFRPWEFTVFCNSYGVDTLGTVQENRQSIDGSPLFMPEYKVFLLPPDTMDYPTGELSCVKALSTVHQCNTNNYCINLEASRDGYANVFLDIDIDGVYDPFDKDVMFDAVEVKKDLVNCINWNGLDNDGNPVPKNDSIPVYAYMIAGITHLPMNDVERCGGLNIQLIRPEKDCFGGFLDSVKMYWDDRNIAGSSNLNGCIDFCRYWEMNGKTNNTWWYIINERTLNYFVKRDTALMLQLDSSNNEEGYYYNGDTVILDVFFRNDQFSATGLLDTLEVESNNPSQYQLELIGVDTMAITSYTGLLKVYYRLEILSGQSVFNLDFDVFLQNKYCNRIEQVKRFGILKANVIKKDLSCFESKDGQIVFQNVRGGSGNYLYSIDGGIHWNLSSSFDELNAGTYELWLGDLSDPNNILIVDTLILDQPDDIIPVISWQGDPVGPVINICPKANKMINSNQSFNVVNQVWVKPDGSTLGDSSSIIVDQPGLYKLKGYDSLKNCVDSTSVEVQILDSPQVQFAPSNDTHVYQGEQITYSIIPEQDHVYQWSIVHDGIINDLSKGDNISVAWDYSVEQEAFILVEDTDTLTGCSTIDSLKIDIYIVPELEIDTIILLNGESCSGSKDGRLSPVIFGGEGKIDVSVWQDGKMNIFMDTNIMAGQPVIPVLEEFSAGQYQILVSNQGIVSPDTFDFSVPISSQSYLTGHKQMVCEKDTACIWVEANTSYDVYWFDSDGDSLFSGDTFCTPYPGRYRAKIIIKDICMYNETFFINEPDSLDFSVFVLNYPFCEKICDGSIGFDFVHGALESLLWKEVRESTYHELDFKKDSIAGLCEGQYFFMAENEKGCKEWDTVQVTNENEICLKLPNAFTPNGDNVNDMWKLKDLKKLYPQAEVFIYDRWGQQVFCSSQGYPNAWDGTCNGLLLPIDSYHYIIHLNNKENHVVTGQVTILR